MSSFNDLAEGYKDLAERYSSNGLFGFSGIPIVVTDHYKQRRTHKKKRINKKWAKRYGIVRCGMPLEDGRVLVFDGKLYMNQATFYKIRYAVDDLNTGVE